MKGKPAPLGKRGRPLGGDGAADCIGENTLVALIEGSLDGHDRADVEGHVAGCGDCRALLSELGKSSLVAGAERDQEPAGGRFGDGSLVAGRYRVLRFVARGGMGEVYEAEDLELSGRVALKLMRDDIVTDARAIERFKREIQLARRVTHPNVCRIFDGGMLPPDERGARVPFLTMEFLEGETLAERLHRVVRLTVDETMPLAAQLAAGLQAAHDAGVVHRDFKSANIVLVSSGGAAARAVITDFGVARASHGIDLGATTSSARAVVGSPGYMAPEQLEGTEATAAADVYAFGVVLYEMITGHLPFAASTPLLTALRRLEHPATPPRTHVPDLNAGWQQVLLRCLERKPQARFCAAAAVYAALVATGAAPAPSAPPPAPVAVGGARRARWRPILAISVLLATSLLLAGVEILRGRSLWPRPTATPAVAGAAPPRPLAPPAAAQPEAEPNHSPARTGGPDAKNPAAAPLSTVLVRSEPPGARVTVDGRLAGRTPLILSVALPHELALALAGYRSTREIVTTAGELNVRLIARRATASSPTTRLLDE